jgi:hypothetical protein
VPVNDGHAACKRHSRLDRLEVDYVRSRGKNKKTRYCWGCGCALDNAQQGVCPNCGRKFVPWDSTTYRTSAPAAPPKGAKCLGCGHCLEGLERCVCPRCGRSFDVHDRSTYQCLPGSPRLWRSLVIAGIALAMGMVGLFCWYMLWAFQGDGEEMTFGLFRCAEMMKGYRPVGMALTVIASIGLATFLVIYRRYLYSCWNRSGPRAHDW